MRWWRGSPHQTSWHGSSYSVTSIIWSFKSYHRESFGRCFLVRSLILVVRLYTWYSASEQYTVGIWSHRNRHEIWWSDVQETKGPECMWEWGSWGWWGWGCTDVSETKGPVRRPFRYRLPRNKDTRSRIVLKNQWITSSSNTEQRTHWLWDSSYHDHRTRLSHNRWFGKILRLSGRGDEFWVVYHYEIKRESSLGYTGFREKIGFWWSSESTLWLQFKFSLQSLSPWAEIVGLLQLWSLFGSDPLVHLPYLRCGSRRRSWSVSHPMRKTCCLRYLLLNS